MSTPLTFDDVVNLGSACDTDSSNPAQYAVRISGEGWFVLKPSSSGMERLSACSRLCDATWMTIDKALAAVADLSGRFPEYSFKPVRVSFWRAFLMWLRMEGH